MAKSKKVYGSTYTVVDELTGEILELKSKSTFVNNSPEKFFMITTTNGLDWAKKLKSYLLFLFVLYDYSDKSGIISLSPQKRREMMAYLGVKNSVSFSNILKKLIELDAIKRVSGNNEFMINPETVYSGSVTEKPNKILMYNNLKQ